MEIHIIKEVPRNHHYDTHNLYNGAGDVACNIISKT